MIAFVYWSAIVLLLLPTLVSSEDPVNFHHDIDDNTVTVGHEHACALEDVGSSYGIGGEIICWGDGTFGQLDSPPVSSPNIPSIPYYSCIAFIRRKADNRFLPRKRRDIISCTLARPFPLKSLIVSES